MARGVGELNTKAHAVGVQRARGECAPTYKCTVRLRVVVTGDTEGVRATPAWGAGVHAKDLTHAGRRHVF